MATKKPKRIEDMSEAELNRLSTAAYNKAMPNPEPGEEASDFKPKFERAKTDAMTRSNAAEDRASRVNAMGDTYKKGGSVGSASKRADGIAMRGKTRGKIC